MLPNGKVLVAGGITSSGYLASAELYDPASGTWTATGSLATARAWTHGDIAAQRQGAGRRRIVQQRQSRERGTLRSGERDLGRHRQPRHRTRVGTRRLCCLDGKVLVAGGKATAAFSQARNSTLGQQPPSQPMNISTRMGVLTGDQVLIGGFIITGNDPKKVVVRAIGPSLGPFGIANPLADPVLELAGPTELDHDER